MPKSWTLSAWTLAPHETSTSCNMSGWLECESPLAFFFCVCFKDFFLIQCTFHAAWWLAEGEFCAPHCSALKPLDAPKNDETNKNTLRRMFHPLHRSLEKGGGDVVCQWTDSDTSDLWASFLVAAFSRWSWLLSANVECDGWNDDKKYQSSGSNHMSGSIRTQRTTLMNDKAVRRDNS